jgi:hypothetical protein
VLQSTARLAADFHVHEIPLPTVSVAGVGEETVRRSSREQLYPDRGAKWEAQLARLAAYKAEHGDCNVPRRWAEDQQLGTWVDRQRMGKRLLDRGEPSDGMTAPRAAKLEALGFVWDPGNYTRSHPDFARWE